jgi:K+-transporting ATPase ATPase C chain
MLNDLTSALRPALVFTALFALLLGLAYPALVTGAAQLLFPAEANGSLVSAHGRVVGSSLIGQGFTGAAYFHPRPSAAGKGYDATASGGSNYGPTAKALVDRIKGDITALRAPARAPLPADLVTASASGLDPDLSPEAAAVQAARIAQARRLPEATVRRLIAAHTESPLLGFLGEPRVNVLALNLALDAAGGAVHP